MATRIKYMSPMDIPGGVRSTESRKAHMEKVLREEGWRRDNLNSMVWWDPVTYAFDYENGLLLQDAYPIACRRRASRERRELKGKGWGYDAEEGWGNMRCRDDGKTYNNLTREEAIQLERGRG